MGRRTRDITARAPRARTPCARSSPCSSRRARGGGSLPRGETKEKLRPRAASRLACWRRAQLMVHASERLYADASVRSERIAAHKSAYLAEVGRLLASRASRTRAACRSGGAGPPRAPRRGNTRGGPRPRGGRSAPSRGRWTSTSSRTRSRRPRPPSMLRSTSTASSPRCRRRLSLSQSVGPPQPFFAVAQVRRPTPRAESPPARDRPRPETELWRDRVVASVTGVLPVDQRET